jgi:hypothetical protein
VLLGLFADAPLAAQVPSDGDFLLYLRDIQHYEDGIFLDEGFVFRDGEVVFKRVGEDGTDRTLRARANEAAMAALNQVLIEHKVGQQTGDCAVASVAVPLPPGGRTLIERRALLTWFGRGDRHRHLPLRLAGTAETPPPCSQDVTMIADGVFPWLQERLEEAASAGPSGAAGSLLFGIHSAMQEDVACGEGGFEDTMLLFRDGLLVRRIEDQERNFQLIRSQGTESSLHQLWSSFVAKEVGRNGATCRLSFFTPFLIDGGCLGFTWQSSGVWHGRQGRRAVYFGSDQVEVPCQPAQQQIQRSVNDYVRNTLGQPARHVVEGRFPLMP